MQSPRAIWLALSAFAILLSLVAGTIPSSGMAASSAPLNAEDLLRQMAPMTPDDCTLPLPSASTVDVHQSEDLLFRAVDALVADRLNGPTSAKPSEAESRARAALLEIEHSSSDINKGWPPEERFHFEVLALHPAILVRMSYRDQAMFVLFGSYYLDKNAAVDPGTRWRGVDVADPDSRASGIDFFPLHRGPSGRARFLARVWRSGCAGSIGEAYYGYEWSPEAGQLATQIIKIEGAEGLDDAASKRVGKLSTTGKTIQLPYCFFSAVDTWDNPTLCAADLFDLSGDEPHFVGRIYNSPDLVVVNNAIQHAQARDYLGLRGYCVSGTVARKLVREIPPYLFADVLETFKASPTREKVVLDEGAVYFNLVKRRGEWRLESFKITDDR
ncbi:MAG TPA: hypothetical protein VF459_04445 [Caulobacteraceae bacterium]